MNHSEDTIELAGRRYPLVTLEVSPTKPDMRGYLVKVDEDRQPKDWRQRLYQRSNSKRRK